MRTLIVVLLVTSLGAPVAMAQEAGTQPANTPPAPEGYGQAEPPLVIVEQSSGGYAPGDPGATMAPPQGQAPPQAQGQTQAGYVPPANDNVVDGTRVRWGFTIFGGVASPVGVSSESSGVGGASARIGVQIDNTWGVYYQASGVIGAYALAAPGEAQSTVFAAAWNTVMGSATLFHMLDFGLGLSVDSIAAVSAAASSDGSAAAAAYAGTSVGIHARAALIFGRAPRDVPRRGGFSLVLDLHNTFIQGDGLLTATVGLGGDWY